MTQSQFYHSKAWETLIATLKIERTNADGFIICEYCGKPITRKYDCIAHHKIELNDINVNDPEIALNPENIQLIHHACHNKIHERFQGRAQKVYLVWGAPCAGKSSWVNNVAYEDDLIVDLDRIWESICNSDRYHKPNRLKANVFGVRDCLIEQIKQRKGRWRNCYLIGTYALKSDRDRLCDLLGAEDIYIDATKEECLSRAPDDNWRQYIEEWFTAYTPLG